MFARRVSLASACVLIAASLACGLPISSGGQSTQANGGGASSSPTAIATTAEETPTASPELASPTPAPMTSTPAPGIRRLPGGAALTLSSIEMLSISSGWAVGKPSTAADDHILRSSDGGRTWADVTPPEPVDPQTAKKATAFFRGDRTVWVAYSAAEVPAGQVTPVVWHSTDGGQTWASSQQLDPPSTLEFFSVGQIAFLDDQTGWLLAHLGAGMNHDYIAIYGTRDGGATWTRLIDPDTAGEMMGCSKDGLGFVSSTTGWIAGDCHGVAQYLYLYQTVDGGKTWAQVNLNPPASVAALYDPNRYYCGAAAPAFNSGTTGAVLVTCSSWNPSTKQSWLYVTADAGQTWLPRAVPAGGGLLQWLDASHAWVLAGGAIYRTTDGGMSWKAMAQVSWTGEPDFVDQENGWIVARAEQAIALVHSSNGGKSWEEIKPVTR